ncbi:MAG: signal peptidase I [Peptococcaceae bacterium]|nr:signal peptidase I [Peptococcaceae bacterium]
MNGQSTRRFLRKLMWVIGAAALLLIIVRVTAIKPYEIQFNSMEPTLLPGDRVLVNKLAYRFWAPNRGDVMVFQYPKDPERILIKRVIGLEGEKVEIKNNQLLVNDQPIREPYLKERNITPFPVQYIPQGQILVLGDNRNKSKDSRDWGLLPKQYLLGKAFYVYWPYSRLQLIN